jgi:8-oxo-dGTP pyrophosphatase MutT (NUDIX family)
VSRVEYWHDEAAPEPNSLIPSCGVLAVDDQARILLQQRRDTGQWALPMGRMDIGETPTECAVRETLEETGVLVRVDGLLGIYSDPAHIIAYGDGEVRQEYEVIMLGSPISGEPMASAEASDVQWVDPDNLGQLDMHPTQRRQIEHYLTGTFPHID